MIRLSQPISVIFRWVIGSAVTCLFVASINSSAARGEAVVSMFGTVQSGSLNGTDLAGADFVYGAVITDTTDLDDVFPDIGTFAVETAFLDFGGEVFDFGSQESYFSWGLGDGNFYAGALLNVDVPTSTYTDGFNFSGSNATLTGFDPESLVDFGPFTDFDQSFTFNTATGPFSATNDLGDQLILSGLSNSGGLLVTVTAIPEPSSFLTLTLIGGISLIRVRRKLQPL